MMKHEPFISSKSDEDYTPAKILNLVVACLVSIQLDPYSNSHNSPNVPADKHFTLTDDGLKRRWKARTIIYESTLFRDSIMDGKACQ